jgi:hypothetical protein
MPLQVHTNSYTVGFGDINRGINMRSEFLDMKWRALLTEIDMSYRQQDGTSELPFTIDEDLTMCDWRNSFSDGSKMFSWPAPWPVKPQHASHFYLANKDSRAYEYTGAISGSSWKTLNFLTYPWAHMIDPEWTEIIQGERRKRTSDEMRIRFVDQEALDYATARLAAGQSLPSGMKACEDNSEEPDFVWTCDTSKRCTSDEWCSWERFHEKVFNELSDTGCACAPTLSLWLAWLLSPPIVKVCPILSTIHDQPKHNELCAGFVDQVALLACTCTCSASPSTLAGDWRGACGTWCLFA